MEVNNEIYLFTSDGSGSGKTTTAKRLEAVYPDLFVRTIECTTRTQRKGEIDGIDYFFLTDEEYDRRLPGMFQSVQYQYLPDRYGGERKELHPEKWNVVVLSFEGFLSALNSLDSQLDEAITVNILGSFVGRDGRDSSIEEKNNLAVIRNLQKNGYGPIYFKNNILQYIELNKEDIESCLLATNGKLISLIRGKE